MKKIIIIHSSRRSLLPHLKSYFEDVLKKRTEILRIVNVNDIDVIKNDIINNKIERFVFSNGSDQIDVQLKKRILSYNKNQKLYFSENAWLTWQDFLYLDPTGIGNNASIYNKQPNELDSSSKFTKLVEETVHNRTSTGKTVPYKNYVLVPLQVDNDSKLIIGSPHFKMVHEFVSYIIKMVPDDVLILFKNHPDNKNKVTIPKRKNVKDITDSNYSRKSLIENSLYVAGINTTFLIESIFYGKLTAAFGLDVFSNKDIVCEGMNKTHNEILSFKHNEINRRNFINTLINAQIPKKHMIKKYKEHV